MRTIILGASFLSLSAFSQIHTTTGSGNFLDFTKWDCFCIPANGDSLVINHNMILNTSIYYNSGQIKVNSSGSLVEDATDRDVWVDGTGSLINNGTFDCYRLYISDGSFVNTSTSVYFDSLWNQGNIANSGLMTVYDALNDQAGTFTNSGEFIVENNFNNSGDYLNSGTIELTNNFSNCNIQSMDAIFINDGVFCIGNNFSNCVDDTLTGTGEYFVGGSASNFGVFDGAFDFNTPTGTLSINTGTVDAAVNFGTAACYLSVEEQSSDFSVYPNPTNNVLYVSESNLSYVIMDLSGKLILSGTTSTSGIDVTTLASGIYTIQFQNQSGEFSIVKFVKQ